MGLEGESRSGGEGGSDAFGMTAKSSFTKSRTRCSIILVAHFSSTIAFFFLLKGVRRWAWRAAFCFLASSTEHRARRWRGHL